MLAKIIVHGRDRHDAIRRLRAALANTPLLGLKNNGRFLSRLWWTTRRFARPR